MYEPEGHIRAGRIIARHSTNRVDIREVIRSCIPLDRTESLLDLGCGYGFIWEQLEGHLRHGTRVVGVDRDDDNRWYFEARVAHCGGRPEFFAMGLPTRTAFPDGSFDTVLSVFSFYYFPGMAAEVRRLLRPGGCFVAVTHCADSFQELNRIIGDDRVFGVLEHFNDTNGFDILSPYFSSISVVRYENRLRFSRDDADDLERYLRFKRPGWMGNVQAESIVATTREMLSRQELVVTKNDIIFVCVP
ncbi:MAG: class I SAM-dependent methyltransferase [Deltaproteobacteria bacterium]|nr:class I SAM-dependent methyltransferase [Deltaproteobacteria bacterium]